MTSAMCALKAISVAITTRLAKGKEGHDIAPQQFMPYQRLGKPDSNMLVVKASPSPSPRRKKTYSQRLAVFSSSRTR
jgi:hypothetical protein